MIKKVEQAVETTKQIIEIEGIIKCWNVTRDQKRGKFGRNKININLC